MLTFFLESSMWSQWREEDEEDEHEVQLENGDEKVNGDFVPKRENSTTNHAIRSPGPPPSDDGTD